MEEIKVKEWLSNNFCDGSGDCYGSANWCDTRYLDGSGDSSGYGYLDGSGDGSGNGSGYGSESGSGYGFGDGDGINTYNGNTIYEIDDVQTAVTHLKANVAKGFILNNDFSTEPCYIVKGNGYFAHGKTIREAQQALVAKYMEDMDEDEVIEKFLSEFKHGKKYKGTVFFDWHHYLTGSCLMGRESFVKNHGLDLEAEYTVDEFISLCENDYGGEVIKHLKEVWNDKA